MKIIAIDPVPIDYIPLAAPPGGAQRKPLAVQCGWLEGLPDTLEALLVCSDLQGREDGGAQRLLGEVVAEAVERLAGAEGIPPADRIGVLLAGDLFARLDPERRGGLGDVTAVWRAFAERFRWVAGVLGNHDLLEAEQAPGANTYLLDGHCLHLDGLTIGGVSGIIGSPGKPNRKSAAEFCDLLLDVLGQDPAILLLHQGPALPGQDFPGSEEVSSTLECVQNLLVVCGHVPWAAPLGQLGETVQVLNADSRVILLLGAAKGRT